MARAIPVLPDAQSAALLRGYASAVAGRRSRAALVLGTLAFLAVVSGWMAEVRPDTFFANIQNFTSYISRILPPLTLSDLSHDVAAWYWNLPKWLLLLGETILIAYLGTIVGAIGAFCLCFLASANLAGSPATRFAARRFLEFCRTVPRWCSRSSSSSHSASARWSA